MLKSGENLSVDLLHTEELGLCFVNYERVLECDHNAAY